MPTAIASAEPRRDATWRALRRHQGAALAAGVLDFGAMILGVQELHLRAVSATVLGASLGAVTNFTLGRSWVFRAPSARDHSRVAMQGVRYALTATASAGFNALGEYVFHDVAHVHYLVARIVVAVAVGLLWNFHMQRRFVFGERRAR
ncbi:MAG: GtrA family protein [Myxococcota bacterium]|nr:GtrA family protein [Myxococcota bacterium]